MPFPGVVVDPVPPEGAGEAAVPEGKDGSPDAGAPKESLEEARLETGPPGKV